MENNLRIMVYLTMGHKYRRRIEGSISCERCDYKLLEPFRGALIRTADRRIRLAS